MKIKMSMRNKNKVFLISKETFEWWIICFVLIFSFINSVALSISMIMLLFFLKQREIGAIKVLNLITLRTIINPAIAVGIEMQQNFKWIIIFSCSLYLLSSYFKLDKLIKKRLNKVLFPFVIFAIYSAISSFIFSTLPIVAIFKLFSYVIAFGGIVIGIAGTSMRINWIDWLYKLMTILFLTSLPLSIHPVGYLRNGHSFQGLINHPNMLGILAVLFVALIISRIQLKSYSNLLFPLLEITSVLLMIFLSKSRTSLLSVVILIAFYLFFSNINHVKKAFLLTLVSLVIFSTAWLNGVVVTFIEEFIYKGQDDLLYSRISQVDGLVDNFIRSPWFGSGFAVPVTPFRTFAFSTEYVVEPGNLVLAVLSYGGFVGFALFVFYMVRILMSGKTDYRKTIYLYLAPILISMGEMVFFSTNNIGIWLYMFIALSIFTNLRAKIRGDEIWR